MLGKEVTVDELIEAFKLAHESQMQTSARRMQEAMSHEDGCRAAMRSFHANLPLARLRSDLEPTFAASIRLDEFNLQVSRPVAQVLLAAGLVEESQFRHHHTHDWQFTDNCSRSESDAYEHPHNGDSQAETLSNGSSNSTSDGDADRRSTRTPSGSVELLVTNTNRLMKPLLQALVASTERGIGESILPRNFVTRKQATNDFSLLAHEAATISGFSPQVCKQILLEFSAIKRQRRDTMTS